MKPASIDRRHRRAGLAVWGCLLLPLAPAAVPARASAPVYGYTVLRVLPHDPSAFTQGLILEHGSFYEGTGLYGGSSLRRVDVETGTVLKRYDLGSQDFGEGITSLRDTLHQLTFQNHVRYTYVETATGFERIGTHAYPWDGWGLTHDGTRLIASDGTSTLRFLDPATGQLVSSLQVQDAGVPVVNLNELEYVQGRIYSNVWYSNRVAVIDPATGSVEAWLDLAGLADSVAAYPTASVLNGIAFDAAGPSLYVTGKRWPKLFEIDAIPLHTAGVEAGGPAPGGADAGILLRSLPNPCRGRVRFSLDLPARGRVALDLFDLRGRRVRPLLDRDLDTGRNPIDLDFGGLASGVYVLRLTSARASEARKIAVIR